MSDTPETDQAIIGANGQWCFELRDVARRLERQRDAYAETLKELRDRLESYWSGVIEERHPELAEDAKADSSAVAD